MFFKKYIYGDTAVYFAEVPVEGHPGKTTVGFAAYPADVEVEPKKLCLDGIVQVAFTGDEALVDYTRGVTMRNRNSTLLKVVRQVGFVNGNLNTYLTDEAGNEYVHRLFYDPATGVFTVNVRYDNRSNEPRTLEFLAGLSLSGIASPATGNTCGARLHRMTSAWSRECRLRTEEFSDLGLDMSWGRYGIKTECWGQVGGMPNRGYYPFGAVEAGGVVWAVKADAPGSWQMEVYEEKETCSITSGLAGYERGHWRKKIAPNGSFSTEAVRFTVKRDLQSAFNAFLKEESRRLSPPAGEERMPVLYNEYCASWGKPSEAKVDRQLALASALGAGYFVIDCGWYRPDGKEWVNAIGDWNVNRELFPDLPRVVKKIKEKGMKAGIWFEFENTGRDSEVFRFDSVHLRLDGKVLTSKNRRFLDLRNPEVEEYLNVKLLSFLKECGFEYLKIDYNDTYGIGCDSPDGAGEGAREVAAASIAWLDRLRKEIPSLVIENCASGGSRLEPLRMSKVSMCSFSDAHECPELPLVAANVTRVVPARQTQIWAVIRRNETDSRTIYSLCAAMLGRICLSGDLPPKKSEKFALIKAGLDFYGRVCDIVRDGEIAAIDCNVAYYRDPKGRQVYVKDRGGRRLVIVHFLDDSGEVNIPLGDYTAVEAYTDLAYEEGEGSLKICGEPFKAGAFLLEK